MCAHYSLPRADRIYDRFDVEEENSNLAPGYDVFPLKPAPVVISTDKRRVEVMMWGLLPFFAKDTKFGRHTFNAVSETVFDKISFKRYVGSQRCIIPADGIYEFRPLPDGKKEKTYIKRKNDTLLGVAGIYNYWKNPVDNKEMGTFTMLTTAPSDFMKPIHDRGVLVLEPDDEEKWLDPDRVEKEHVMELLRTYQTADLQALAAA